MPPGQFGCSRNSPTQATTFPVPNSQGRLCIGGSIGRYTASIFNWGAAGIGSLRLDLAKTLTPIGPVAIQLGRRGHSRRGIAA